MENAGTCACWIFVWVKSIMYSCLVTVVSVAVRILVILVRKNFGVQLAVVSRVVYTKCSAYCG